MRTLHRLPCTEQLVEWKRELARQGWLFLSKIDDGVDHVALATLTEEQRDYCRNQSYQFVSSSGIQSSGLGMVAVHPFLETLDGEELLRYSYNCMQYSHDPVMTAIMKQCFYWFNEHHVAFFYQCNSFLIWDNWRVLHSRTAFEDNRREIKRVFLK
ncbi:MAG: hypothetical protein A2821_04305 [Candidatus Magasanikbacteria bacterium RIFCSPHIGHO2_01_FULL_41_23]|uniref:TauD/TfdA-like domain-containing protein n=1 Tax=Candidatus Magasanikbacteria bacterium RIFCSPLOWO2_01_FULL_40_15 TaxID=1798686 RepID=A0A1F6N3W1_9BACT|nr:MAG: hypothetical protein A2821_04305 [Candidatus Magasanikbacteria bacterium RIFCSPHIGHO2_01_FULL_41_23]OGH67149.1 MAG: hypothetical protein A3C66_02620 [Candidatus Magasanikbacteria bacterium RIFCSPHIGHO2_02_FULL_41_35]OGH76737.1 MAG: hypothetical protein A3F22_03480 [Candidatus Magasanikbacteria bacterium RIFCSPHIGHO2_12_FULL_41_16]OGH78685.1 MAG: hypothetical protein A2983_04255 [Candidatus Magasanikbacteria bacterium RIFCSPLOWO2_01_FULL_40_15]